MNDKPRLRKDIEYAAFTGDEETAKRLFRLRYRQEPGQVIVIQQSKAQLVFIPKPKDNIPCSHTSTLSH